MVCTDMNQHQQTEKGNLPSSRVGMVLDATGPSPCLLLAKIEQLYTVAGVKPSSVEVPACVYCIVMLPIPV